MEMVLNVDAGLHTFLMSTSALMLMCLTASWYEKRKKQPDRTKQLERVLSSPETSWKKVGTVSQLLYYPVRSSKAKFAKECHFSEYGIVADGGAHLIEDRMFAVYQEETRINLNAGYRASYRKLLMLELSFVSENRAKIEVGNMPTLEFDLPDVNSKPITVNFWKTAQIDGIDCGPEPAKWLSRYLYGEDSGARLAMRIPNNRRNVTNGPWNPFLQAYPTLRNEDSGQWAWLASYMVLSKESVDDLNKRLDKPIPPVQLRPNLVVEGCDEPYAEDNWEWIKIGDQAIIRRFKLCMRCLVTTVDPETGASHPKCEPLRTLRSYRKLKNPELHKLEEYAPAMGTYCGLYRAGNVRVGDDVYVYQDDTPTACPEIGI